jgi:transcriptional regulator with XRE-family HTH domain
MMRDALEVTGADSAKTGNGDRDARAREGHGRGIRLWRTRAALTQAAAAELLGISDRTLRDWERGVGSFWTGGPRGLVDYDAARKMADAYGVRLSTLLPNNTHPSAPLDPPLRRRWFWDVQQMLRVNTYEDGKLVTRGTQLTDAELDALEVEYQGLMSSRQRGEK